MTKLLTARLGLLGRHPAFRDFWTARVLSELGDGTAQLALILFVSAGPQGGLAVGGLLLASGLPRLVGPVAGVLADRRERRRVMVVCDLLQALLYLLMAALLPHTLRCWRSWRSPPRWRRPMGRPAIALCRRSW